MSSEAARRRLERTVAHLAPSEGPVRPRVLTRDDEKDLHWNGWGYRDTGFQINTDGDIYLSGTRYDFSGTVFPHFRPWIEGATGVDINQRAPERSEPADPGPATLNDAFLAAVEGHYARISLDRMNCVHHGHGHTCQDVWRLRHGRFSRVPDAVIYPGGHADCERIVAAAAKHDVVIIPYGGGTSVSHALWCPPDEKRMIVSLDMHEMARIKWIDKQNMTACVEAGIVGKELEEQLNMHGVCMGHEPDSVEFSTLGGWVSTRASGMQKNVYGNIEDIVVHIRLVTPTGTVERACQVPRVSAGPDVQQMVMGSEGTLGVVTEVVIRLRPLPAVKAYASIVFPCFEDGVAFMREVAYHRVAPASIRLVDNEQFQFGMALKPQQTNQMTVLVDKLKKLYVTKWKQFDPKKMVVATCMFVGNNEAKVTDHKRRIMTLAGQYGGIDGGEGNGKRGYFLTFMIAYLRDFGYQCYGFLAESFETTVPWANVLPLCRSVKARIHRECRDRGLKKPPFVSCRVTQTYVEYDTGACVYFYFGALAIDHEDPEGVFSKIEHAAREEVLANGGSLSHHHGIGKHRTEFLEKEISAPGLQLLKGIKRAVDPKNIFGNGNLMMDGS